MATKKPNTKNTKAEILAAYTAIENENKRLESQLSEAQKATSQAAMSQISIAPDIEIKDITPREATPSIKPLAITAIIQSLDQLQLYFGSAASALSEQITSEVLKLREIQGAVSEETEQLQTLHNLQVVDDSLTDLIEAYETNAKTLQEEFDQQQEALELAAFHAEKAWEKEQEDHHRTVAERNALQTKRRQRDTQEYTYTLTLQRKLSDEVYEQAQTQLYQELEALKETQTKQWADREAAIAEREQAFEDLKTQVESFPEKLAKAVKQAKEEGKGIALHQAKIKSDLALQDIAGQKRTYELRIASLEDVFSTQDERLESLSAQLDAALQQVQDLAIKAIEGASNLNSLKSIREIAIEQAKNPNKSK